MGIKYKRIKGFPKYAIDSDGNVWSKHRFSKWRVLKGGWVRSNSKGGLKGKRYKTVQLRKNGRSFYMTVHRLVWKVFNGDIPSGIEINHKDGNKKNNKLNNLELSTKKDNIKHAVENGLYLSGENHGNSILTWKKVRKIRKLVKGGMQQKDLALQFGVSPSTISAVHRKIVWKE